MDKQNKKVYESEKYFFGYPVEFKDKEGNGLCWIYCPTIKEIIIDKSKFRFYQNLLTMEDMDVKKIIQEKNKAVKDMEIPDVFSYLLESGRHNPSFLVDLQKAFYTFVKEEVTFLFDEKLVVIGDVVDKRLLDKDLFYEFQNEIRVLSKIDIKEPILEDESPMQRKFRLKREERDFYKRKQNSRKGDAPEYIDLISSVCALDVGVTYQNVGDLTLFALYEFLRRGQERDKFKQDISSLLAGADKNKVKPKFWIRNLKSDD